MKNGSKYAEIFKPILIGATVMVLPLLLSDMRFLRRPVANIVGVLVAWILLWVFYPDVRRMGMLKIVAFSLATSALAYYVAILTS
jgi:hypothetical protein